jgi:hypothetical protein
MATFDGAARPSGQTKGLTRQSFSLVLPAGLVLPTGQLMQKALLLSPAAALCVPASHSSQLDAPGFDCQRPGGQSAHSALLDPAEKEPAAQGRHTEADVALGVVL